MAIAISVAVTWQALLRTTIICALIGVARRFPTGAIAAINGAVSWHALLLTKICAVIGAALRDIVGFEDNVDITCINGYSPRVSCLETRYTES